MATLSRLHRRINGGYVAAFALIAVGLLSAACLMWGGWQQARVVVCLAAIACGVMFITTGATLARHRRAYVAWGYATDRLTPFFRWLGPEHHRRWVGVSSWLVVIVGVWWVVLPIVVMAVGLFRRG